MGVARLQKDDEAWGNPRRKHSREFKLEAVKQFEQQRAVAFPGRGRRAETEAEAEIHRLQRELSIALQECTILKIATANSANAKS